MTHIKRIIASVVILAIIISLIIFRLAFSIYIDEFKYKINCIEQMANIYNNNLEIQSSFAYVNQKITNLAINANTNHYEIFLPDGYELMYDQILQKSCSFIRMEYQFLRNSIFIIVYDNKDIYYVFEESEYIIAFSESDKSDVTLINNKDKYFRHNLDDNACIYIKFQYYD